MSPLVVAIVILILLAVLAAALSAWLQIARDVIADEGDDADKDGQWAKDDQVPAPGPPFALAEHRKRINTIT